MSAAWVTGLVLLMGAGGRAAWMAGSTAAAHARLAGRSSPMGADSAPRAPHWMVQRAAGAGLRTDVIERAWPAAPVLAITGLVGATLRFGVAGSVLAAAAIVTAPVLVLRRLARRESRRRARALPLLLEDVALGLRSGASLRQALLFSVERADVSLQPELQVVCDTVGSGGSLSAALETWRDRQPAEGLGLAVAALTLGIDAGGAHGKALDAVAASLRDRLAVQRELAALSSQARASAGVMVVAPVLFAAFTVATDPRTAHFLLGTAAGVACLVSGLLLDAMAAWWMLRLTGAEP